MLGPDQLAVAGTRVELETDDGVSLEAATDASARFQAVALSGLAHFLSAESLTRDGKILRIYLEDVVPEDGPVTLTPTLSLR